MRVVIITGSRKWKDIDKVFDALNVELAKHGELLVAHGDAKGADAIAKTWASRFSQPALCVPANWSTGRSAGVRRNHLLLELSLGVAKTIGTGPSEPVCHAFPLPESVGTYDMVNKCRKVEIEVFIHAA